MSTDYEALTAHTREAAANAQAHLQDEQRSCAAIEKAQSEIVAKLRATFDAEPTDANADEVARATIRSQLLIGAAQKRVSVAQADVDAARREITRVMCAELEDVASMHSLEQRTAERSSRLAEHVKAILEIEAEAVADGRRVTQAFRELCNLENRTEQQRLIGHEGINIAVNRFAWAAKDLFTPDRIVAFRRVLGQGGWS